MIAIEGREIEQVVASEISRISRSVRDLSAAVERIVDEHGGSFPLLDMGVALNHEDSNL